VGIFAQNQFVSLRSLKRLESSVVDAQIFSELSLTPSPVGISMTDWSIEAEYLRGFRGKFQRVLGEKTLNNSGNSNPQKNPRGPT